MKVCTGCKIEKPLSEFYPDKSKASGYRSQCKTCRARSVSDRSIELKYGLTRARFNAILESQGGVCALCKTVGTWHVDHDHACCAGESELGYSSPYGPCIESYEDFTVAEYLGAEVDHQNETVNFDVEPIESRIAEVQFAGRCLARYIDWCKAASLDY